MIFLTLMKPDKMETAIIESVTEKNDPQYGPEKISKLILQPSGESRTAYTKPAAQTVYSNLRAGLLVELKPKNGGKGYLIQQIIGEAHGHTPLAPAQPSNGQAPAPARDGKREPSREEIAQYIDNKAGHVARAYVSLKQHFAAVGEEFTPEIFNSTISTVIISLDKHFGNDASAWGDPRPLLVAGSPEWDQTVAAIRKHGTGTVDKVIAKARVSPAEEEYLRQIEKQAGN